MKMQVFTDEVKNTQATTNSVNDYIAAEETAGRKVVKQTVGLTRHDGKSWIVITVWTETPQA